MSEETLTTGANGTVSDELRGALQRCDQALSSSGPVLRHLVANSESSLFHEEVLARVRGMLDHLGTQMLRRYLDTAGHANDEPIPLDRLDPRQRVELFKLVTSGDYEDMRDFGAYIFYCAGRALAVFRGGGLGSGRAKTALFADLLIASNGQ